MKLNDILKGLLCISIIVAAIVYPAHAVPLVLTCPDAAVTASGAGYVIVCGAKDAPVPPVTPPPVGSLCVANPVRTDFPKAGSSPPFVSQIGIVNTWKLPQPSGTVASTTEYPGTPQSLTVEWAISKCPGDFEYYKTDAAKVTTPRGQRIVVCGGTGGQSAGVKWGYPSEACVIPAGETWYINLRYISGAAPNVSYTITMGLAL